VGTLRIMAAIRTSSQSNITFCQAISKDETSFSIWAGYGCVYVVAGLGLAIMLYTYIRIYKVGTKIITRSGAMYNNDITATRAKYRATVTTLWILGTFIVLWFPTLIFNVILYVHADSASLVLNVVYDIMTCLPILNSVCDPIIYAIRLRAIRTILTSRCCGVRQTHSSIETTIVRQTHNSTETTIL
jgi:hypothetical protein